MGRRYRLPVSIRKTRSQQKNRTQIGPEAQRDATTSDDSSTESEDLSTANLVKELVKLRGEIRRRDELHREELQKAQEGFRKAKEEFGAALPGVRHELQTLSDRTPTPQSHTETCAQNNHDEILREIQSLRDAISASVLSGSSSYADVARTPPLKSPEQHTDALNIEYNINHGHRHAYRDEDEHQLVKKVAEVKIGAGTRVLRDELHPIKVDSRNKAAVLDEKDEIRAEAAAAFSEENEATVAKIAWLSRKKSGKAYGSMVVYLTKGTDARKLLADGFFHAGGESGVTSAFAY
ncbi:hypothetical protein CBS147372_9611 [Penicillium roqueforti]|nr:hypothetical protein CBS147372_9611 [Penicillium roqueforti]